MTDARFIEPYRRACPQGHRSVMRRQTTGRWVCRACRKAGTDPYYETVQDCKTGELIHADSD